MVRTENIFLKSFKICKKIRERHLQYCFFSYLLVLFKSFFIHYLLFAQNVYTSFQQNNNLTFSTAFENVYYLHRIILLKEKQYKYRPKLGSLVIKTTLCSSLNFKCISQKRFFLWLTLKSAVNQEENFKANLCFGTAGTLLSLTQKKSHVYSSTTKLLLVVIGDAKVERLKIQQYMFQ